MLVILPSWRKCNFQVKGVSYLWLHTCLEFLRSYELSSRSSAFKVFFIPPRHSPWNRVPGSLSFFYSHDSSTSGTLLQSSLNTMKANKPEGQVKKAWEQTAFVLTPSQNGWGWRHLQGHLVQPPGSGGAIWSRLSRSVSRLYLRMETLLHILEKD